MSLLLGLSASAFLEDSLFPQYWSGLWRSKAGLEVLEVCRRFSIPPEARDTVMIAYILYRLLSSDANLDAPSPLLIHYIYLDERPRIRRKGRRLPKPALEQTPDRFFRNLFSPEPEPPFLDPETGDRFYAYGWCSELAMAYANALGWFGIEARVLSVGPVHVAVGVKVAEREFVVDNTFGGFFTEEWRFEEPWNRWALEAELPADTVKKWNLWYNKRFKARAWDGPVPPAARRRLREAFDELTSQK